MDFELDEMRQQMAILKNKLNEQTIVNDRFIRRAIKHGVSTINKRYLIISIIALATASDAPEPPRSVRISP